MDMQQRFHWADYLVFLSVLLMSFIVGVYQRFTGGRQKSTNEYLMGDRYAFLSFLFIMQCMLLDMSFLFIMQCMLHDYVMPGNHFLNY